MLSSSNVDYFPFFSPNELRTKTRCTNAMEWLVGGDNVSTMALIMVSSFKSILGMDFMNGYELVITAPFPLSMPLCGQYNSHSNWSTKSNSCSDLFLSLSPFVKSVKFHTSTNFSSSKHSKCSFMFTCCRSIKILSTLELHYWRLWRVQIKT